MLGLLFFFLAIARCVCRGLWDTAPTVGKAEPWSGFFSRGEVTAAFRKGKNSVSFSFPRIHKQMQEK